jgi:hypothetical protein
VLQDQDMKMIDISGHNLAPDPVNDPRACIEKFFHE